MQPAQYWRQNKNWHSWIGRKGTVVVSTLVNTVNPQQAHFKPFSYVLVDFGDERHEFMGAGNEEFLKGDQVICVLRKIATPEAHELIPYGIKVKKIV